MSTFVNPAVVKSGLVLAFDAGNGASYRGEATTNLIPSPTVNAYPTSGNGWGTYNTNQYGSGAFFSIGTISSVSSNIVTTAGTHGLRTYDVMRPQTTGGGVTANVDYFIRRISDTQFTLHEYNSSQDGSQGYINSSTGYHKVHDSIANDVRVSVNSTNFPNMWWGAPHLPNSGLVKEIITKGFTGMPGSDPTDCLRQHITRPVGADHMAYNVDASVTIGQPVVSSFWARAVTQSAVGKSGTFYHYNYGGIDGADAFATGFTLGEVGVWQRYTLGFTPTRNTLISYWFNADGGPYSYDIADIQIEQRSTVTPFVAGTRGTTVATNGGLRDMSGNSRHGELINGPTFDSGNGGSIVFDGNDDKVLINSFSYTPYCLDFWLYNNSTVPGNDGSIGGPSQYQTLWSPGGSHPGISLGGWTGAATNEALHIWSTEGGGRLTYTRDALSPAIYNWVFNWNGSHYDIWVNGVKQTVYASSGGHALLQSYNTSMYLASDNVTYEFYGKIYTFKMYTSQLTDLQISQNFNATRARFGV
jgi:hypothetical protein